MKTTILFSAIAIFTLCGFSPVSTDPVKETTSVKKAPVASHFESFRTHRQGREGITATWSISPGNDVSCFIVERTYDDPSDPYATWDAVSNTPCNNARSYKCTDNNVFPGFLSYRVTAFLIAGGSYASPVSTIHIISH